MGKFLKSFIIWSLIFWLIILGGSYLYIRLFDPLDNLTDLSKQGDDTVVDAGNKEDDNLTPFQKAVKDSDRINVLVVGLEHTRTDTIMLASYDRKNDRADLISVPRDTYYLREGYEHRTDYKKINAIYGTQGIGALIDAVSDLTSMPIHKYVLVDYEALAAGVNALGGVNVYIPMDMDYDDPSDTPPLSIHFKEGNKLLYGQDALRLLRFRKNNDGSGYPNGDIGRIATQQKFIEAMLNKMLSLKLIDFINEVYPYINTNFKVDELISLAGEAPDFSMDNFHANLLPGDGDWIEGSSFFVPYKDELLKLVYEIYGVIE